MKKILLIALGLLPALLAHSQPLKPLADSLIINHIFEEEVGHVDIFSFPQELTNNDTIFTGDGDTIRIPYTNCIGYFVDLMPFAHWAHPCKYCFVKAANKYKIVNAEMPPRCDSLIPLTIRPRPTPSPYLPLFDTVNTTSFQLGNCDPEHLWAVLICGDDEYTQDRDFDYNPDYWFDLSCVYTVLANKFGYQENTDTTLQHRRIIVTAPFNTRNLYVNTKDLNGNRTDTLNINGDGDFFYSWNYNNESITHHNKANIKNVFDCFAGISPQQEHYSAVGLRKLDETDQLFIFITGHGKHDNQGSYINILEDGSNRTIRNPIHDFEFANWLQNIECSQMTLFVESCYSGGFVDRFMENISESSCRCKNRIGISASFANEVSHQEAHKVYSQSGGTRSNEVSELVYYWSSAALGYYPYLLGDKYNDTVIYGPWEDSRRYVGTGTMNWETYFGIENGPLSHSYFDINPDADQDGILSLAEMFEFANNLDTWSPQGCYDPIIVDISALDTIEHPQQYFESSFTKEAASLTGYQGQIDSIANSGTAMQPYRLCGDIWVSPGSELTMRDTIQSPGDVIVYIKPSGKMILDGGTLNNLPEEGSPMWQGVQVWGDAQKHQLEENGRYWQGYFELKNGATVENAIIGIDVWKPGCENSTGGIVVASDASFINNTTAVYFHPYENRVESIYQPGLTVVHNNASSFRNCQFSIDKDYIGPDLFERHVNLFRVRGVDFHGCDFRFQNNSYSYPWPIGLHAYDAGFNIKGICMSSTSPCQTYDKSTFDGFYKAVAAVSDGSIGMRPFTVKETDFSNNSFGVFTVKSNFATVLNSSFEIGQDSTQCAAGIFMEGSPHFTIEQDTFNVAKLYPNENYGIVIKDSRSQNVIYRNVLKNLYCANLSVGRNNVFNYRTDSHDHKTQIFGLEYRCNDNSNNLCDFYVLGGSGTNGPGIQKNQGAVNAPANNVFSHGGYNYNFMNYANYDIVYYYNSTLGYGMPQIVHKVINTSTADTIGCPFHYGSGGSASNDTLAPVLSRSQRIQREADYYEAYTAYHAIKALYDSRIDGGDTQGEIGDIQSATPSDMWELRAQLLGHSPYLSYDVLASTADRQDVFPQSVLFEILSSNPDELRRDTLISYLQNMDNPLPNYMIGLLQQIAGGITARTAMESQMAQYSHEYQLAAGDVVRSILNDSVFDYDDLIAWLGNMEDIASDREIVSIYMENGDFTNAMALANMLPSLYNLTDDDITEQSDYMVMLNLYRNLNGDGRTTMQLNGTERATVEHMADYGTGMPQAMAKAIMMEAYGYRYDDCPSGVDLNIPVRGMGQTGFWPTDEDLSGAKGFTVSVSPNPARTWASVDYTLPIGNDYAQMAIFNIHGKNVATYRIQGNESQKVLDLRDLVPGVYTYTVSCGKLSQTGKLVIVK